MIKEKKETLPRKVRNLFGELVDPASSVKRKSGYSKRLRSKKMPCVRQASFFDNQVLTEEEKSEALKEMDAKYWEKYQVMSKLAANLGLKLFLDDDNNPCPQIFIEHPLFKTQAIEARWYSLAIANQAVGQNSIIVVPTGLGKTYIFFLLLPTILAKESNKKIIMLCPTKPLCQQHYRTMIEILPSVKTAIIYGQTSQKKRLSLWQENQIIIATPQTILAELKKNSGLGKPEDIKFALFDEIHHASKQHAYAKLAAKYVEENPDCVIHNLTASPDHKIDTIRNWQKLLKVDDQHLFVRNYDCSDVKDYVHCRHIKAVPLTVEQSELQQRFQTKLVKLLADLFKYINSQVKLSISAIAFRDNEGNVVGINIKGLEELKNKISTALKLNKNKIPWEKKLKAYELLRDCALLGAFNYAVSVNDKGLSELSKYLQRQFKCLQKKPKKFQECLCKNYDIRSIVTDLYINRIWKEWPTLIAPQPPERSLNTSSWKQALVDNKLPKLVEIIKNSTSPQFIVFVNTRDTLRKVIYYLKNKLPQKSVGVLTGTASNLNDPGLSQKGQIETLNEFRNKKINILVSTSVGEEGLDFPAVDAVIFFEPIVEIRRYIQRLGRTARHRDGTVYILISKNTEEEKIYYISRGREKKVNQIIKIIEQCQNNSH